MNVRRIGADLKVFGRNYLRNAVGLFFSLIFPIILIALFGLIFSASGPSTITLYTENLDAGSNASVQFLAALNATGAVQVQLESPPGNFSTWLGQNSHPVGLIVPAGFGAAYAAHQPIAVTLFTNPQDSASSGIAQAAVGGVLTEFNLRAANGSAILVATDQNVGSPLFKEIDYLVPGLIGFSILTSPMFAMVDISSTYRKEGLFRQLSLTPLTKGEWLTSKILWYIGLTVISAALMIAVGVLYFGAHLTLSLEMLPFLILGPMFFVSLGMLAGSVARSPESAAVIGNIITFPMMFLSGTFFPVSLFPEGLRTFAHVLPLFYVIDGLNQVMLFHNTNGMLLDLVVVAGGSVVVFVLAILAFRWREG